MQFYSYVEKVVTSNVHILIAGCTGSGKSVLLNSLLCYILTIDHSGLILIDPKKVELAPYRKSCHTIMYGDDTTSINQSLKYAVNLMHNRYTRMQNEEIVKSNEAPIYIIIDELAQFSRTVRPDLAVNNPLLAELATLGRAANIFLIACTQRPTNDVITPLYKVNCDCKIALRTSTEQESRNIIGISDAAHFSERYGHCIISHPDYMTPQEAPVAYHPLEEIKAFIAPTIRAESPKATPAPKKKSIIETLANLQF